MHKKVIKGRTYKRAEHVRVLSTKIVNQIAGFSKKLLQTSSNLSSKSLPF